MAEEKGLLTRQLNPLTADEDDKAITSRSTAVKVSPRSEKMVITTVSEAFFSLFMPSLFLSIKKTKVRQVIFYPTGR